MSEDDSGPKFDLMIPGDIPIGLSTCEEEGLDDPSAGIYCVHRFPRGLALVDSDGDGRTEVLVTQTGYLYVFEQTATGLLEETLYSPFRYPKVGEEQKTSPSIARIVAMPRAQGKAQDWLVSWEEDYIDVGELATAELIHPTEPQARFVFSDWRSGGDWFPQVARLEQGLAAAYIDREGQLTVRIRDQQNHPQNQWSPPVYYQELQHKGHPVGLETEDLNQDGHQDLVVFGYNYHTNDETGEDTARGIAVRLGDGQGDFSSLVLNQLDIDAIVEAKLGDVTGDGLIDAILMDKQQLHVASGLGEGLFDGEHLQTIDFSDDERWNLSAIHAADFNGDQRVDVALSDCEHDLLHILLASPDGELVLTRSTPTVDCVRTSLTDTLNALDVDDDGNLDLLALGQNTETLRVYFGDGKGSFVVQ